MNLPKAPPFWSVLMISAIVSPLSQTLLPLPDDIVSLSFQSQHVKVIPNDQLGKIKNHTIL
jgi:hypothetical protein